MKSESMERRSIIDSDRIAGNNRDGLFGGDKIDRTERVHHRLTDGTNKYDSL